MLPGQSKDWLVIRMIGQGTVLRRTQDTPQPSGGTNMLLLAWLSIHACLLRRLSVVFERRSSGWLPFPGGPHVNATGCSALSSSVSTCHVYVCTYLYVRIHVRCTCMAGVYTRGTDRAEEGLGRGVLETLSKACTQFVAWRSLSKACRLAGLPFLFPARGLFFFSTSSGLPHLMLFRDPLRCYPLVSPV